MAIFLATHNMTMEQFGFLTPEHNFTLPTSVIDMFMVDWASRRAAGRRSCKPSFCAAPSRTKGARRALAEGGPGGHSGCARKEDRPPAGPDEVLSY